LISALPSDLGQRKQEENCHTLKEQSLGMLP
jgi:hypothetical protein